MYTAITSGYRAGLTARRGGGRLLGAAVAAALAVGGLSQAQQANATCVSFSTISFGQAGHCTTSLGSFALAIGPGATASATGGFLSTAVGIGAGTTATTFGNFDLAADLGATSFPFAHL